MKRPRRHDLLTATACFVAVASASYGAEPSPPPSAASPPTTVQSVIVTARKPEPKQLPKLVYDFARAHGQPGRIGQISRWADPICAATSGLPPTFNAAVSARVAAIAQSVGAPTAKDAGCRPNLLIVFTMEPQKLLDTIRKDHPEMLGFHYAAQLKRLATVSRPIQAWYATATKGTNGDVELDCEFCIEPSADATSRLTGRRISQIVAGLVVVDANKVGAAPIGVVADQVAVLGLARPAPPRSCGELPSVLDAINPDCRSESPAQSVTVYDSAYLKALYAVSPELFLGLQRSEIASRMMRELNAR